MELSGVAEEALAWHTRLNSGEATEDDWAQHADWLAADPVHMDEFIAIQDAFERVDAVAPAVRAHYAEAPVARVKPTESRSGFLAGLLDFSFVRNRPALAGGFAFAVIALVIVGTLGVRFLSAPQMTRYATLTGEVRHITLPDGSTADLDTNSELLVAYADDTRFTELTHGRAVFDVEHNPKRPFIVQADGRDIRVLGTKFEVSALNDSLSVAVARGLVGISSDKAHTSSGEQVPAGEKLTYTTSSSTPQREKIDPQHVGTWADRRLTFDRAPLAEVVKEVNRYFPGNPFRVETADLETMPFTGSLYIDDEDVVARNLSSFMSLSYRRDGNSFILEHSEPGKPDN
jgi:transmembrane sensor